MRTIIDVFIIFIFFIGEYFLNYGLSFIPYLPNWSSYPIVFMTPALILMLGLKRPGWKAQIYGTFIGIFVDLLYGYPLFIHALVFCLIIYILHFFQKQNWDQSLWIMGVILFLIFIFIQLSLTIVLACMNIAHLGWILWDTHYWIHLLISFIIDLAILKLLCRIFAKSKYEESVF